MPRVYLLSNPAKHLNHFYNIDRAVGRGCPNGREDVLLVQLFLRRVLEGYNDPVPGEKPLLIDGSYGSQTQRYIDHWQKGTNLVNPTAVVADGVISSISERSGLGSRSGRVFGLILLNIQYSDRWGKEWHSNLAHDPLCPTAQLPSIFWS
jgi:hypothetical protein